MAVSPAHGIFEQALSRFKISLTPSETNDFEFSSLQDVYDVIEKIQQEQASRKCLVNLNRMRPFLDGMQQYGSVIEVFLNTSNIVAFIWGPIKFLLLTASNLAEAFDQLLEAYEMLGENIPQFQQYEKIFEDPRMGRFLGLVYQDILEFHRRALKVFKRRGWRSIFGSSWKAFGVSFQYILNNLQRHKRLVEIQATLEHFGQEKIARDVAETSFRDIRKAENKRQRIAVTQWLGSVDSNLDQEKLMKIRHPGTGSWLFKDKVFKTWYNPLSTTNPVLWVSGIPGSGKTILTSLVVEEARKLPSTSVCFFYCKYGDPDKNTFSSVARGLILQLLNQDQDLLPFLYDKQAESGEIILKSQSLLKELFAAALAGTGQYYLVIDGLDECELGEQAKILEWLVPTVQSIDSNHPGGARILFMSRDEGGIRRKLSKAKKKQINTMENLKDMEVYLQAESQKIRKKFDLSDPTTAEITLKVLERAKGMFLFSYLVMENLLGQTTEEELEHELQPHVFPAGLGEAYARVVKRIYNNPREAERKQAKRILGWLVCAKRPLKWHEIQGAVSINLRNNTIDFRKRHLRVNIKDLCGSLVEVEGDTIELVHTTAKFHLVKEGLVKPVFEELNFTTLCVKYLTFDCFDTDLSENQVQDFVLSGHYTFQDYAAVHWTEHLQAWSQEVSDLECDDFQELIGSVRRLLNHHWASSKTEATISPITREKFKAFEKLDIFEQLVVAGSEGGGAENLLASEDTLGFQIQRMRSVLEQLDASLGGNDPQRNLLQICYGLNWFRCKTPQCLYFHKGFSSVVALEEHNKQHTRPFRCTYTECHGAVFGCSSKQELLRHIADFHPAIENRVVEFPEPLHSSYQSPQMPCTPETAYTP